MLTSNREIAPQTQFFARLVHPFACTFLFSWPATWPGLALRIQSESESLRRKTRFPTLTSSRIPLSSAAARMRSPRTPRTGSRPTTSPLDLVALLLLRPPRRRAGGKFMAKFFVKSLQAAAFQRIDCQCAHRRIACAEALPWKFYFRAWSLFDRTGTA